MPVPHCRLRIKGGREPNRNRGRELFEVDVEAADPFALGAGLDDDDITADTVLVDAVGLEEGVAVAADDDVDVLGILGKGDVVGLIRIAGVTEVGEGDDQVALLHVFQVVGPLVGGGEGVHVDDALQVLSGDQGPERDSQTEDAYLLTGFLHDNIRLHQRIQSRTGEVVVGADGLELCLGQTAGQLVHSVVVLVVADGSPPKTVK